MPSLVCFPFERQMSQSVNLICAKNMHQVSLSIKRIVEVLQKALSVGRKTEF